MGLFDFFRRNAQVKARSFDEVISAIDNQGIYSAAGVRVTESSAMQVSTVMACVELIARDVASLPLQVRRMSGTSEQIIRNSPIAKALQNTPNPWQTAYEFKEQMTAHAVLRGNAYAWKNVTSSGRVGELWPLRPDECSPEWRSGRIVYIVNAYDGQIAGTYEREDIFHLRGLTWNGKTGLDRLMTAKGPIGLASALEGSQSQQMENGSRPSGILTTDQNLKLEQIKTIAESWKHATTKGNAYKTPVLDGGFKFNPVTMKSTDAQVIETRKHQIVEICASFGVLPAILGIDDKTQAFASVEAMMRWHLAHTLRPWLVRWEQALDRDCLDGGGPMYARFDTREFQKASTKERAEAYRTLVELGIMTRNEARDLEGLAPLPGGDVPLQPMNMNAGAGNET